MSQQKTFLRIDLAIYFILLTRGHLHAAIALLLLVRSSSRISSSAMKER